MSDFADKLRQLAALPEPGTEEMGSLPSQERLQALADRTRAQGSWRVLARQLADVYEALVVLEDAAAAYEALQNGATDARVGLVQPVTVAEANALNAALDDARRVVPATKAALVPLLEEKV